MTYYLTLPAEVEATIRTHAEHDYPEECCGTLLGRDIDGRREIVVALPIENTRGENRERRYLIEPKALLHAEQTARKKKLDVVGIYHSHPDHPSQASEFDRVHAMPYWSYVIVACEKGTSKTLQSFRLREDRSVFDEEIVNQS